MRASRGLRWENKMYKLKRSIELLGKQQFCRTPKPQLLEGTLFKKVATLVSTIWRARGMGGSGQGREKGKRGGYLLVTMLIFYSFKPTIFTQ